MRLAVQSVFTALDRASPVLSRMGANVDRYSRQAQRAGASIGASWSRVRGLVMGATALLTTGAIAKAVTSFSDSGDEIAKTARMLGLSAQSLQELRFAADREGVSAENLTTAFRLLNNNTGQLRAGQGALYSYLKQVNPQLALQARNTRTTEEAFLLLMDAIGKEGNSARRAALAQAAFGRSGQELIKLAAAGTDGIAALRAEAQRLGLVMSDEAAHGAEEFQDRTTDLKAALRGLTYSALPALIEKLTPLIARVTEWIIANRELIGQKVQDTISRVVGAVERAVKIWRDWKPLIIAATVALVAFNVAVKIGMAVNTLNAAFKVLAGTMGALRAGLVLATGAQWSLNAALDANPVGAVIIGIMAMVAAVALLVRYWDEITEALRRTWNWFNKLFNNPAIKLALYAFAMPLAFIASVIKTIVDLVNGEGWKSFLNMAGPWKALTDALGWTKKGGGIDPARQQSGMGDLRAAESGVSPNLGVINSNTTTTRRSVLDVIFKGAPAGTALKQTGAAPDINVDMFNTLGYAGL